MIRRVESLGRLHELHSIAKSVVMVNEGSAEKMPCKSKQGGGTNFFKLPAAVQTGVVSEVSHWGRG